MKVSDYVGSFEWLSEACLDMLLESFGNFQSGGAVLKSEYWQFEHIYVQLQSWLELHRVPRSIN